MTFITLFSGEHGFVATDQCVYSAAELQPLSDVLEQATSLENRLSAQTREEVAVFEQARASGFEEGLVLARAELGEQIKLEVSQLHEQHREVVEQVRESCAQLAVDIVRKIAGRVEDDRWLAALAQQAAENALELPLLTLRVHSDHAHSVRDKLESYPSALIHDVIADDSLSVHACVLDTGSGQIDVCMETQLSSILAMLMCTNTAAQGTNV